MMTSRALLYYFLPLCALGASYTLDLNGEWSFSSKNGSIKGRGIVPGDIFSDLFRNNIIDDPIFGDNSIAQRWVALDDWIYQTEFNVNSTHLQKRKHRIVFEGLDTIATVFLNNALIFKSKNQFRRRFVSVELLPANNLTIIFHSPLVYARKQALKYAHKNNHFLPPVCPPEVQHGECHPNFIRKAQYSFSWDWGPSIPTVGIWKPVSVVSYDDFHVFDISWNTEYDGESWKLHVEVTSGHHEDCEINIALESDELEFVPEMVLDDRKSKSFLTKATFLIPDDVEVELWWPRSYGAQKMYDVRFLVRDQGSNWIPVSMFPSLDHTQRLKFLLDSALETGMNALRVWGGGFYESEEFYNYADERGLLIWQDLMFACALYPTDASFISDTVHEVSRLKKHPSIIIWAGNNENELAIRTHWWKTENYSESLQVSDYKELYRELLKFEDTSRPKAWSSPSNGIKTTDAGGVAQNPGDVRYGDIHFYNDFTNQWRDDSYLTPRCASEYGVQSYPLSKTMKKWINKTSYAYTEKEMVNRQHHIGGILSNLLLIFNHFPVPKMCESSSLTDLHQCEFLMSEEFMARLSYFSQIHQAVAYKVETMHYRRFRNTTTRDGLGNTMCAMYWQLNDVWAAPTWSSIDFDLNWKMVHYYARKFFADIAVYSFIIGDDADLKTVVVNDKTYPLQNVSVVVEMYSWGNKFKPIYTQETRLDVPALSAVSVPRPPPVIHQIQGVVDYVYVTKLLQEGDEIAPNDYLLPDFLFEINSDSMGNVTIEDFKKHNGTSYSMTVFATALSPFTWIDVNVPFLGYFSDNGFTMTHPRKEVQLLLKTPLNLKLSDFIVCNLKNCFV